MIAIIIIAVLVVVLVLVFIGVNNSMIGARNRCDEAWSGIDVQLKRRHDLIPNLVETVKGYATHERETFEKVTQARADAMKAQGPAQSSAAEGRLSAVEFPGGRKRGWNFDLSGRGFTRKHLRWPWHGLVHRQFQRLTALAVHEQWDL